MLQSPVKQSWEYIAAARVRIADSMLDTEGKTVPDLAERVNAYFDLAWLQDRLERQQGCCDWEASDSNQNAIVCYRLSVAFCQGCGMELCLEHLNRVNGQTRCEWCA